MGSSKLCSSKIHAVCDKVIAMHRSNDRIHGDEGRCLIFTSYACVQKVVANTLQQHDVPSVALLESDQPMSINKKVNDFKQNVFCNGFGLRAICYGNQLNHGKPN